MKRLLIVFASVLLVVVGAVALATALIPVESVKAGIAGKVTELTGRPVTFKSDPSLSLFPLLRFRLDGVVIGNPPEFGEGEFLAVDSLRAQLKFLPLLLGRLEFSQFTLIGPHLYLQMDQARNTNWSTPLIPTKGNAKSGSGKPSAPTPLGRIVIRGGTITYMSAATNEDFRFDSIEATIDWPSSDRPLFVDSSFSWNGETVTARGSLMQPMALAGGGHSPLRVDIASAPVRVSFAGEANRVSDLQFDGDASITTPSLRHLVEWVGHPIGSGATLGAASISGKANWLGNSIVFSEAKLDLDGNEGAGVLTLRVGTGRLGIGGTLDFDRLDLSPYLDRARSALAAGPGWQALPIALPLLDQVNLDLRLSAGQVLIGTARVGPAAASLVLDNDRLSVNVADAKVHGGTLQASMDAEVRGSDASGALRLRAADVMLKPALTDFAGLSALDGKGSGTLEFSGRGNTWGGLVQSLAGTARISVADAGLAGLDLGAAGAGLREPVEGAGLSLGRGSAVFKTIAGDFTIGSGTLTTRNLKAQSLAGTVSIEGSSSLLSPTISARGSLSLASTDPAATQPGPELPFLIGGTWARPTVTPDLDLFRKKATGSTLPVSTSP